MLRQRQPRNGVTVMECAVVVPLVFLILAGTIIGALGVFRYQEIAALAREGARFAAVRGQRYEFQTGNKAATPQDVYEQVILPRAVALDQTQLTYSVTWSPDNRQGGTVIVQLNYRWIPEALLGGIQFSSTSTMLVSY